MADAGNRKLPRNVYVMLLVSSVLLAFGMRLLQFHLEPLISRDGTIYIRLAEQWAVSGDYPRHAYLPLLSQAKELDPDGPLDSGEGRQGEIAFSQ